MDTTREVGDPRSPKRHALEVPSTSVDNAIWTSIIEFLPMPKDLRLDARDYDKYDATVAEVLATWQTLLRLRLVCKELAVLLHPSENAALWRKLVLHSFDFTVDGGFNVENYVEEHQLTIPRGEVNEDASDDDTHEPPTAPVEATSNEPTERDPQLVAMRGRYYRIPSNYLDEDLKRWANLEIYHRASQYGFLTTLQQHPPVGEWPEFEDAFTLFGDLVRLLQLPHGDSMDCGGEGGDPSFKFLAAPAERDSYSAFRRFYVMKTLGYAPHFWGRGRGIGATSKIFTEPDAFEAELAAQRIRHNIYERVDNDEEASANDDGEEDDDSYDDDAESYEEDDEIGIYEHETGFEASGEFGLPSGSVRCTKLLYPHLREHVQDWRSVCCNKGSDGTTPVFFVGESKASPHRWIGYAGKKTWT